MQDTRAWPYRGVRTGSTRQTQAFVTQIGYDDVACPGMPCQSNTHDSYGSCTGDQDVLAHQFNLLADVNGVAERIEQCSKFRVNQGGLNPDIRGRHDDVVGECSVSVHADPLGTNAHVAPASAAVATASADHVPLDGDSLADVKVTGVLARGHAGAQRDDGSKELMAQCLGRSKSSWCSPVPPVEVKIGPAESCSRHSDFHVSVARDWFWNLDQFKAGTGRCLSQCSHLFRLPSSVRKRTLLGP